VNYIPWSLVKMLHEERVNEGLRASCVKAALRASDSKRKFSLFKTRENSSQTKRERIYPTGKQRE
jgi:hypothetical protein